MRFITFLLAVTMAAVSYGQIVVPKESDRDTIIVATVKAVVPEGATFNGGWQIGKGAMLLPAKEANTVHVAGPPGKHTLVYIGYWIHTKEVTFKDGDGNQITITSFLGSGFINESTEFTVRGSVEPPNPPDPPNPNQKWQLVFVIQAEELDKMPPDQRLLVTSLKIREDLRERGHVFRRVLDDDQLESSEVPDEWKPWVRAVSGDLPLVLLSPKERSGVPVSYPLPKNYKELLKLLEDAK